jgi:hypothetical protein
MADTNDNKPWGKHLGRSDPTAYNPATTIDVTDPTFRRNSKTGKLVQTGPNPKTHADEKVLMDGPKTAVELNPTSKDDEFRPDELAASSKPSKRIMKEEAWVALFEAVLRRQKRKKKIIKLPPNMSQSGQFPDPADKSITERMQRCKEYLQLLDDLERGEKETRANTVIRTMKAKHHIPRLSKHMPNPLSRVQELVPTQSQQQQPFYKDYPRTVKQQKRKSKKGQKEVTEAFWAGVVMLAKHAAASVVKKCSTQCRYFSTYCECCSQIHSYCSETFARVNR